MKCEEVVEWMHRYLDHDLGEAETTQMLQHVAKCPECAENFSMLRALSRELEDLPQVSPKFSLVDAIMPQLDAIDEARKEQSSAVQEMSPVPAAFESLKRSNSSEQKSKTKWFNSMVGRMSVGAAAAAVVLGFAIWGYQPEQIENADSMLMSSGASQDSNSAQQSARSMEVNNDQADTTNQTEGSTIAPDSSNDPVTEGSMQPNADQPEESNGTELKTPDGSGDQEPAKPATEEPSSQDKGKQEMKSTPSSDTSNNQKSMGPNQGTEQKKPDTSEDGAASPPNDNDERSAADSNDQLDETFSAQTIIPNQDTPAQGSEADNAGTGTDSGATGSQQGLMAPEQGTAAPTGAKEWKSPDGSYIVMLLGDQISIYAKSANDPDALNLIEQRNVEGTLKSGSWSKDSLQFNYEIDKDGATTKDTFKVGTSSNVSSAK
ncbi:anti-sigma factor [Paenibacillus xylanexedens]|uniref:anti-sigma factor n=1 Tax=Paenibacillus xylanexedens TaxID=528191 RepID=UPI0011AA16B7|nr:anti-sigma factor [Paenibacillus xylanexedens]